MNHGLRPDTNRKESVGREETGRAACGRRLPFGWGTQESEGGTSTACGGSNGLEDSRRWLLGADVAKDETQKGSKLIV